MATIKPCVCSQWDKTERLAAAPDGMLPTNQSFAPTTLRYSSDRGCVSKGQKRCFQAPGETGFQASLFSARLSCRRYKTIVVASLCFGAVEGGARVCKKVAPSSLIGKEADADAGRYLYSCTASWHEGFECSSMTSPISTRSVGGLN